MKRIFIVSLLALTVALGAVATGCSGGNNSSSTDKSSSKVEMKTVALSIFQKKQQRRAKS